MVIRIGPQKKCSPDFVLPLYMEFYTEQGEKTTDSPEKQAEIVAFSISTNR